MHLLATTGGVIDGAAEAIDLKQTPGDVVILSAADSELANLASAAEHTSFSVRLANLMLLQHNFAVDLYAEKTLAKSKLIIIRVLGGAAYWSYGIDVIQALARENNIKLVLLAGGNDVDQNLTARSTLPQADCERIRQYLAFGGPENCDYILNNAETPKPATPLVAAGFYREVPNAKFAIIFYRSVIEGGQTAPIDALIKSLGDCSAIYVASLKDKISATFIRENPHSPSVIISATSFAVGDEANDPLAAFDCPVLQVTLAGNTEEDWQARAACAPLILPCPSFCPNSMAEFTRAPFHSRPTQCGMKKPSAASSPTNRCQTASPMLLPSPKTGRHCAKPSTRRNTLPSSWQTIPTRTAASPMA
jgi:cobaltochelatase CobN